MLPPGAAVSGKAAQELRESGQPLPGTGPLAPQEQPGLLLSQQESEAVDSVEEGDAAEDSEQAAPEVHLRPLGDSETQKAASPPPPPPPPPKATQGPSSGLSDEATRTSVDISQYMGTDESIFRPIKREEEQNTGTADLMAQRKRGEARSEDKAAEIPENTRLARCLVVGLAMGVFFALAQFLITKHTVELIYTSIRIGRGENFFTALKYGIASGFVFGFGLGALLVKFKKGSFFGMLTGIMVGLSMGNGLWAVIPAAITGIVSGKFATIGVRRVINV